MITIPFRGHVILNTISIPVYLPESLTYEIHTSICTDDSPKEHIENMLTQCYTDYDSIKNLINHGMIYQLKPTIYPDRNKNHIQGDFQNDVCIFYARDLQYNKESIIHSIDEYKEFIQKLVERNSHISIGGHYMFSGDWYYSSHDIEYFRKVPKAVWIQDMIWQRA